MHSSEIQEIGRQVKVRGIVTEILTELKVMRPTLSRNTIYRAFNEPDTYTDLLDEIRQTAKRLLNHTAVQEAA